MKITRENYESFFIDWIDGTLDPSMEQEFRFFLSENPDLQEEMNRFEELRLQPEIIEFRHKGRLKRTGSDISLSIDRDFDYFCVARLEGDLSPAGDSAFEQYLVAHPEKRNELNIMLKTKLKPGEEMYPGKGALKRKSLTSHRRAVLWYSVPAAASLILVLGLAFLLGRGRIPADENITIIPPEATEVAPAIHPVQPVVDETGMTGQAENPVPAKQATSTGRVEIRNMIANKDNSGKAETGDDREELILLQAAEGGIPSADLLSLSARGWQGIPIRNPEFTLADMALYGIREDEAEYLTLKETILQQIRTVVLGEERDGTSPDRITVLDLADAGIRGINRIAGSNLQLDRHYNEEGDLAGFAFNSRALYFSHEARE